MSAFPLIVMLDPALWEELTASKLFVDVDHDVVPAEGLEEGMPLLRSNKSMTVSLPPDWNDFPG